MEHCAGCKGWNCSNCEEPRVVQAAGDQIDVEVYNALVGPHKLYIPEVWDNQTPDEDSFLRELLEHLSKPIEESIDEG